MVPTTIDNDADVAAYAEFQSGAAVGCRDLLYVQASTGVGAGAEPALAEAGSALGRAIGEVSNVLNPSLIVIGGELAAAIDLLIEPLRTSLRRAAMQVIANDLEVRAGQLGTRAELVGAAALCAAHVHGDEPAARVRLQI